ncbi:hypothetical protein IJT17_10865 [bacterium]|nr:hypothetical protein [bacterium]
MKTPFAGKALAICLAAVCFLSLLSPAKADVPDLPRIRVNVVHNGDYPFTQALEKNNYRVFYAYDLLQLLSQDPSMPSHHFRNDNPSLTVKKRYPQADKRARFFNYCKRIITGEDEPRFSFNIMARETKPSYLARTAKDSNRSDIDEELIEKIAARQLNSERPCLCQVATRQAKREVTIAPQKLSLADLPIRAVKTPAALTKHNGKIYIAFLDYQLNPVDITEESDTGRFGGNAINRECYWEKLYIFSLDDLFISGQK